MCFFFFFGICPFSFFVHDCMSSFALSASCLTLQIEFHYRLSDCSFAFQITATAQTLLVALLVPAEGSTHACAQRAVIRVVWFWPVLSIRVPLLHLLLGWNVPWCIGGMLIYQEVSPWRSGALWRSFIIFFFVCVGLIPLITVQDICQVHGKNMTSVIGWGLGLARLEKGCIWSHPFYDRICSGSLFIDGE